MFEKLYRLFRILAKTRSIFKEVSEVLICKGVGRVKEPTVMAKYSESHCHPLEKRGREGAVQWQSNGRRINIQRLSFGDL